MPYKRYLEARGAALDLRTSRRSGTDALRTHSQIPLGVLSGAPTVDHMSKPPNHARRSNGKARTNNEHRPSKWSWIDLEGLNASCSA